MKIRLENKKKIYTNEKDRQKRIHRKNISRYFLTHKEKEEREFVFVCVPWSKSVVQDSPKRATELHLKGEQHRARIFWAALAAPGWPDLSSSFEGGRDWSMH